MRPRMQGAPRAAHTYFQHCPAPLCLLPTRTNRAASHAAMPSVRCSSHGLIAGVRRLHHSNAPPARMRCPLSGIALHCCVSHCTCESARVVGMLCAVCMLCAASHCANLLLRLC
jgi:hypothetical protein